jgi:hypothetical protein
MKAELVFEDSGDKVVISMQNVLSDNPTFAQEFALLWFRKINLAKELIKAEKMFVIEEN